MIYNFIYNIEIFKIVNGVRHDNLNQYPVF